MVKKKGKKPKKSGPKFKNKKKIKSFNDTYYELYEELFIRNEKNS